MSATKWKTLPFERAVHSRGSGGLGLPTKQWLPSGQFPVIGQGAEEIEGWTDRKDLLLTPAPAVVLYGGHTRRAKHVSQPFVPGPNVKILQPDPAVDSKFLFYFLTQLPIESKGYADHFPLVRKCQIPVPPLPEQQRIVGVLDEAFEGLATAKANAEKNLQNARALFESHLQSVFTQRGPGWAEKRLGDMVTRLTNGYVGPTRNIYHDSGVPYLLARHVKDNHLQFDGKTFITEEFNRKNKKSILKTGDVLLVQSGHIGHSAVVTEEHEGHNCHAMIVITAAEGTFIGPFLSLFFNSSTMKQKFQEIRSGSTVPHLTCGEVKELQIPLPDLKTQRSVVDHSRELSKEIKRLTAIYEQKLAALEALKKSLLHQAFAGEL
jgi:restriction endonuclease S subunit